MGLLYKIRDDLRVQYCHRICKRVFDAVESWANGQSFYHDDFDHKDEYGLIFENWILDRWFIKKL